MEVLGFKVGAAADSSVWEHGENTDQELYSDWRAETEQERGKQLHNLDPREEGGCLWRGRGNRHQRLVS